MHASCHGNRSGEKAFLKDPVKHLKCAGSEKQEEVLGMIIHPGTYIYFFFTSSKSFEFVLKNNVCEKNVSKLIQFHNFKLDKIIPFNSKGKFSYKS